MRRNLKYIQERVKQYNFYKHSWHLSRSEIEEYQNKKLVEIVKHAAKNVPYYRELFKQKDIDVKNFRGLEDIGQIPFLEKEVLRSRTDEFVAENSDKFYPKWSKTSGSTGTPLNILLDVISIANKQAVISRATQWAGYNYGRMILMIKGLSESRSKSYGFDLARNIIYFNSNRMTKDNCISVARLIQKIKPSFFVGYARSYIDFYNIVSEEGYVIPKPVGIFCEGENITKEIRGFIEKSYQTKLYDHYGNVENSILACELPNHKQYLMEDYFYPEIVDGNNNICRSGYGELIGTSFYNYAMPLIRYRTRDFIQLKAYKSDERISFREVERIEGRMDDNILLPDGRKIYFAEGALGYAKGIVAAQYIQDEKDHITINLITDKDFSQEYYAEIEKGLIKRIGNSMKFDFRIVSELEKKPSGKAPFIINKTL